MAMKVILVTIHGMVFCSKGRKQFNAAKAVSNMHVLEYLFSRIDIYLLLLISKDLEF